MSFPDARFRASLRMFDVVEIAGEPLIRRFRRPDWPHLVIGMRASLTQES